MSEAEKEPTPAPEEQKKEESERDEKSSRSRRRSRSRSRSKKKDRKKSRSRSRDRSRRRRRSRSRDRSRRSRRDRSRSNSSDSGERRRRRRKKKGGGWDDQGDPAQAAAAKAAFQAHQMQLQQLSQRNQRGCELYVGNLAIGVVTGESLKEFLTKILCALPAWDGSMGPPVSAVQMQSEGKYAFVKFRDEQTAATALKFDKAQLAGRAINIGRSSSYIPTYPEPEGMEVPTEMLASLQVPGGVIGLTGGVLPTGNKKQRELYVGNLAIGVVNAQMLQGLFVAGLAGVGSSTAPPVLSVNMDAAQKFAFVEFRDEETATTALMMFDKMEMCGRPLHVGRPTGYVEPGGQTVAATGAASGMAGMMMGAMMGGAMGMMNPARAAMMNPMLMQQQMMMAAAGGAPAPAPPPPPTTVLALENLVSAEELADDQEYTEIVEDVRTECGKSGQVINVKIPRPGQGGEVGKAFVEFATKESALAAFQSLSGRVFAGNTVKATFLNAMP